MSEYLNDEVHVGKVSILADSINPGMNRLTTFLLDGFPKVLLAELNTHRNFSRNAASSRAIPMNKVISNLRERPYIPFWTRKRSGMAGSYTITKEESDVLTEKWLAAMEKAIVAATELHEIGAAKQEVNRLLEPWMLVPVLVSSTEWDNFYSLRCDPAAQPDFRFIAEAMRDAQESSLPVFRKPGEVHAPFIGMEESFTPEQMMEVATARAARVSYTTHDGEVNYEKDKKLHDSLREMKHMSPFEHSAISLPFEPVRHRFPKSNFRGWMQYRKYIEAQDTQDFPTWALDQMYNF